MRISLLVLILLLVCLVSCKGDTVQKNKLAPKLTPLCHINELTYDAFTCDKNSVVYWVGELKNGRPAVKAKRSRTLLWTKALPSDWNAGVQIETNGKIVVLCMPSFHLGVIALNAKTGEVVWQHEVISAVKAKSQNEYTYYMPAAFTLNEENIYLLSPKNLCAIKAHTGKELWRMPLSELASSTNLYSAPAISEERLYFSSTGEVGNSKSPREYGTFLYCVNKNSGKILWKKKSGFDEEFGDPPSPRELPGCCLAGSRLYVIRREPLAENSALWYLVGLDADTGEENWKQKISWVEESRPLYVAGNVLVGYRNSTYDYLVFDANSGKPRGKIDSGVAPLKVFGNGVIGLDSERTKVVQWDIKTLKPLKRIVIPTIRGRIDEDIFTTEGGILLSVESSLYKGKTRYTQFYQIAPQK